MVGYALVVRGIKEYRRGQRIKDVRNITFDEIKDQGKLCGIMGKYLRKRITCSFRGAECLWWYQLSNLLRICQRSR